MELGQRGGDLVVRGEDEAVELDLHHGAVAAHSHADRGAHDAGLGQRGVDHASLAKVLVEAVGHAEHTAKGADVLAHEHDLGVAVHRGPQARIDGAGQREGADRGRVLTGDRLLTGRGCGHRASLRIGEGRLVAFEPGALRLDTGVGFGVDVIEDEVLGRFGPRSHCLAGALAHLLALGLHVLDKIVGQFAEHLEMRLEACDRVAFAPVVLVGACAVLGGVVRRGVGSHAVREGLDQHGPGSRAGVLHRPTSHRMHRDHVVAVHAHVLHAHPVGALGERHLGLAGGGFGDRELVVLHKEHDRRGVDRRENQGLVDVALAGGTVPVVADDGAVLLGLT